MQSTTERILEVNAELAQALAAIERDFSDAKITRARATRIAILIAGELLSTPFASLVCLDSRSKCTIEFAINSHLDEVAFVRGEKQTTVIEFVEKMPLWRA